MRIWYTKQALKSLRQIPNPQRKHILEGIDHLPLGDIKKLRGYANLFRLRIGVYRILFTMGEEKITIDDVLPRGDAYRE